MEGEREITTEAAKVRSTHERLIQVHNVLSGIATVTSAHKGLARILDLVGVTGQKEQQLDLH